MSESVPSVIPKAMRFTRDDLPKRGDWYHVTYEDQRWNKKKQENVAVQVTELMCVEHLGSNFVEFCRADSRGGYDSVKIPSRKLLQSIKHEPNWQAIIQQEVLDKQKELQDCVRQLADKVHPVNLLPEDVPVTETMLPSTTRQDPKQAKAALVKLKEKHLPEAKKKIEEITQEMVALQRDLVLPMIIECDRMTSIGEKIDERLFVLELYAGLGEGSTVVKEGEPAPIETPITIRQMLRYMDEETLFDYKRGGMDYRKLPDFDKWLAKPENYTRILPEPRCVVAFKIRRHAKDYGSPDSIADFVKMMEDDKKNTWTYLVIRNGTMLARLYMQIDFDPRLLPLQEEFHRPFEEADEHGSWDSGGNKRTYEPPELITPDDLRYDAHVEKRRKTVFQYNRILFLLQGILDRSDVLRPHAAINLGDPAHVEQYIRLVFDEELGLPSANPPKWEEYRDRANKAIRKGSWCHAKWTETRYRGAGYRSYEREYEVKMSGVYQVTQVRKDGKAVKVSWPWGNREGWEYPEGWGRGSGRYGQWPVDKLRHHWVPLEDVFCIDNYQVGDYKPFLCDAYLKGAYLTWAPQLLSAEDWHQQKEAEQAADARKAKRAKVVPMGSARKKAADESNQNSEEPAQ